MDNIMKIIKESVKRYCTESDKFVEKENILTEQMLNENNLAIIGSRNFNNYSYAKKQILDIIKNNKIAITKIISGGASGADKIAETFASKFNIPIEVLSADWSKGKQAGVIRNTDIIKKSNYVIAFWDGESKGTLDSINKAKRLNKKLFIVKIDSETINEGIRLDDNNEYVFDFNKDNKDDLMSLTYNKNFITKKKTRGVISYFSYKTNKKIDKDVRKDLLNYIKYNLESTDKYNHLLNKSVIGLFNNPNIEVGDVDLVLIPQSTSNINLDLASKIKSKLPNALFLKEMVLKNEPTNVVIDYEKLNKDKYDLKTIKSIEKMVKDATVDGVFQIKHITPRFRRYVLNFLILDSTNRQLLNKIVDGKVMFIDDITTEGSTFREMNRLINNYAPKEIILFSLIA